ncbi:nitrate- and nitrite sensing domain-containing protein [Streptomyces sp. NPDC092952]|uniref:nitrate- and nitrite sensing domain-containing protein n=1 Tax=Streptomyces sp. NPDC092952 TaxID=3366018 RepID=UPI0038255059
MDRTAHRAPRPRRTMTVRARLLLLAAVAITALLGLAITNTVPAWEQQRALRNDVLTGTLGGQASLPLFVGAQAERTLTAAYLAHPSDAERKALKEQRARTDAGVNSFRTLSGTELQAGERHRWEYVEAVYAQLTTLPKVREQVDARAGDPDKATGYYTGLINSMIAFYQALSTMDDGPLTAETRPLVGLFYAADALAQQDMLLTQARYSGRMTSAHRVRFAEAYGSQQVMYERWIAPYLPAPEKARYEEITASTAWRRLQDAQRSVLTASADGLGADQIGDPAALSHWEAAYKEVSEKIAALNLRRTQGLLAHGLQRANDIRANTVYQSAVLLGAVLSIAMLIAWLIRSVSARLAQLRVQTHNGAEHLTQVVERLHRGDPVSVEKEFPAPPADEFADVAVALAEAQRTAAQLAARQASDRRGIAAFTGAAAQRTLGHIARSLGLLETVMARQDIHPTLLEQLVLIDGSVTAARRHQEYVGTLAGVVDHRVLYTEPTALLDLVNNSAVETGAAARVDNQVTTAVLVAPEHVAGLVTVLAALLDNALASSITPVVVRSRQAMHGVALEIEDAGAGMPDEAIEAANASLAQSGPSFEAMAHRRGRLGLFVVAQVAARHHVHVALRPSPYRGITAVVMVDGRALTGERTVRATGRPGTSLPAPATPSERPPVPGTDPLPRRQQESSQVPAAVRGGHHDPAPRTSGSGAAALPQRRPGEHVPTALLTTSPDASQFGWRASNPSHVATSWGEFQTGTQQAEHQLPTQ